MRQIRLLTVLLASLLVIATMAMAPVRADSKSDVAKAFGGEVTGKAVIYCIRPSTLFADAGYEPKVTSSKWTYPSSNRMYLTIRVNWYGAITKNPYQSDFTVKLLVDDGIEILGIDYTDDCLFPAPDLRLLTALVKTWNEKINGKSR